jgi:SulP family sulfate permease
MGGRFELSLVILLTAALFFISGMLLPHVPTILASALVLFLGMELFLEATWEASKTLASMEYVVVVSTTAACTLLGFAEGFGIGIGAATVVYLMYGAIDSVRSPHSSSSSCMFMFAFASTSRRG